MKVYRRLPESMKPNLPAIRELASKGLNKGHIVRQLKISVNSFTKYKECAEAFIDGRSDLALTVASAFKKNLVESYSDRVHLSKSLRLFSSGFHMDEIKDVQSAQDALSRAIIEFGKGSIAIDELETIRKATATYVDVTIATSLEERLLQVEAKLNNKKVA